MVVAMFSGNEWLIVAIIALVLFGGSQLPKLARNIGQAQKEFKKGMAEAAEEDDDGTVTSDEKTKDKKSA